MSEILDSFQRGNLRDDLPDFKIGDTVAIAVKITEGSKTRLQNFQGAVIARRGSGRDASITVRNITGGIARIWDEVAIAVQHVLARVDYAVVVAIPLALVGDIIIVAV